MENYIDILIKILIKLLKKQINLPHCSCLQVQNLVLLD